MLTEDGERVAVDHDLADPPFRLGRAHLGLCSSYRDYRLPYMDYVYFYILPAKAQDFTVAHAAAQGKVERGEKPMSLTYFEEVKSLLRGPERHFIGLVFQFVDGLNRIPLEWGRGERLRLGTRFLLLRAMRASREKILVFLFAVLTLVLIAGATMYVIEGPAHGFENIPLAV
jgi:hypothetical protein